MSSSSSNSNNDQNKDVGKCMVLDVLQVVVNHNEGEEITRLREENRKLKEVVGLVDQQMSENEKFYFNLVWAARTRGGITADQMERIHYGLGNDANKIRKFEQGLQDLRDPNGGDWHHGFNSGLLATARLAMGLTTLEDHHHCQCMLFGEESEDESENEKGTGDKKCGPMCYWTAKDQREQAIGEFPMLDS